MKLHSPSLKKALLLTLSMISASAGQLKADSGGLTSVDQFLQALVDDWRGRWDNIEFEYQVHGEVPGPKIISEEGLRQSLVNFLDNAAHSSPESVEMSADWGDRHLSIEIADRGQGLPQELKDKIGKEPFTTKVEGHGLGLFLAYSILQRLGGEVEFIEREGGGLIVRLELDLKRLLVDDD